MSYANQAPTPNRPTDLEGIQNMIGDCRALAASTIDALDRAKGAQPAQGPNKVSAVPNGAIDNIRESLDQLRAMLEYASGRANELA